MTLLAWIRSLAAKFLDPSRTAEDMDEELRAHIQQRAADLERSGINPESAQRRARIEFGAYERYRQESHEALGGNFLETLVQDVRFGARVLLKSPGFTATAILTLALAIGANALVFGILNALILRPINLPGSESLYEISNPNGLGDQSYLDYKDLRDRNRTLEGLAAFTVTGAGLDTGKDPSQIWLFETSGNYFDLLGIQPYAGRLLHASDEHGTDSAPFMVLSYAYWHSHFNDDPQVIGRIVQLNKHPFTVIGVTPPGFHGTVSFITPDVYTPLVNQEQVRGFDILDVRGAHYCITSMVARLRTGVTREQAEADLNAIGSYLEKTYPKDDAHPHFVLTKPGLFGNFLGRPVRAFVTGLMLLAGLILLAACANLGSLFAARAADRSREVALRLALGSSRSRIIRQMLTEAVLISLAGGTLGLAGSVALLQRLSGWQPFPRWPIYIAVDPDVKVCVVALLLAIVSGLLFGIVPARRVMRANPYTVVKAGSTATPGRRMTLRDLLLVVQISICAVLVTSSMVAVRGLIHSLRSNFGFEPHNVTLAMTDLNMAGYTAQTAPVMQKRMIDSMQTIPGVEKVGLINSPPLDAGIWITNVFKDSTIDMRPANAASEVYWFNITPEYLEASGTPLWAGRNFTWHDDKNGPRVAIVNRTFAARIPGSVSGAVGSYFKMPDGTRVQVVGVVDDGKYLSLTEDTKPAMFLPILQSPASASWLVVRAKGNPKDIAAAVRNKLRELDPGLPAYIEPWNQELDFALFPSRVASVALGILGLMGAMLSVTGIFGMAAYSVSKRLRELGIRVALGAQRTELLGAALGRALKLLALGSAAGLVLGILATRVLAHIVYQASPRDPLVLTGVVVAMGALGLVATWLPARRALSADPLELLREE
jgi:predicted permease